jgi:hypothetical protein
MKALSEKLKQLEMLAGKKEKPDSYADIVDHFTRECQEAVTELKRYDY